MLGVFWNPQDLLLMIFDIDASWTEKLMKKRVSFVTAPTVDIVHYVKCIFRQRPSDNCPGESSESESRDCNTVATNSWKYVCNIEEATTEIYNFKACMGNSPDGDECKVIGSGPRGLGCTNHDDWEFCIQDCNQEGCAVSCLNLKYNTNQHLFCTGCRNGRVKMEGEESNFNITCEHNGEELPGDLICEGEEKCGCVPDEKTTTGTLTFKVQTIFKHVALKNSFILDRPLYFTLTLT